MTFPPFGRPAFERATWIIPELVTGVDFHVNFADLPQHFNGQPQNIGILLGEPSGGLIDMDLDTPESIRIAPRFLPKTDLVFGRESKPRSHWVYHITGDIPRCEKWEVKADKGAGIAGVMIVEMRGTGAQTVFPPSVHRDTGESICFDTLDEPARVDAATLRVAVRKVAAGALLAQFWPTGSRWEAALSLAGGLGRAGWKESEIAEFIEAVADAADDDDTASTFIPCGARSAPLEQRQGRSSHRPGRDAAQQDRS
ncbi:MAG: bifunctional DNA primase/polymerase, partial [Pyrinomonadaceae bacterium]|nr:bifunctional DNA primase/polymerase [Phycisphaerales bacterium]